MTFKAIEFDTASEAIQYTSAGGGEAILLDGKNMVVAGSEAQRLAEAGVYFAYFVEKQVPDGPGRIMTIPVN
jgi:hypothetical protein